MKQKRSQASYTVEAAVLTPVILAVVVALVQICFVLHDRVIVREALEYMVMTEEADTDDRNAREENTEYRFGKEEGAYLISEPANLRIEKSWKGVEGYANLKSEIIVPFLSKTGGCFTKEYRAVKKTVYAKEKTIVCELILDTLHILQ